MKDKVLRWCREQGFFSSGDRVICAVSGGADSMAMLHCLYSLRQELQISVEAAHYNHCLRGEEAQRDQEFVEEFCIGRQIPLHLGRGDVAAYGKERHLSTEEAARQCRYAFLSAFQGKLATAHNADDHLETVLMHLLRGSGLRGLGGIPPQRGNICRPLLCVTREEILAYLQAEGLPHREDSSNRDLSFTRNRLRHEVLPLLRRENPRLADRVLAQSGLLRGEDRLLDQMAGELLHRDSDGSYALAPLIQAPDPLQKRALRLILGERLPQDVSLVHIEALQALLHSPHPSGEIDLPTGLKACRLYDRLELRYAVSPAKEQVFLALTPGQSLTFGPYVIQSRVEENFAKMTNTPFHFSVRYDMITGSVLCLRSRQIGDRLQMSDGHSRSLKKLMIEGKIPRRHRDGLPIFTYGSDVVAAAGLGVSHPYVPKEGEPALIIHIDILKEETT
jgi:tRNA(Ile)-lysidine synthase